MPKAYHKSGKQMLLHGNSFRLLKELPADSISAVVTDPPYELKFMNNKWDSTGITYDVRFWQRVYRVMKPGAFLLAFGGTRTAHRLAVAIEDAGFEIRDSIIWIYGSGFPKSLDVSKAIDKEAGAKRKKIGSAAIRGVVKLAEGKVGFGDYAGEWDITEPATNNAKKWEGWGTALKPAHEPIIVARKPLAEKTVAKNVLRYGTGAMNIDGSRIESIGDHKRTYQPTNNGRNTFGRQTGFQPTNKEGRWPANVILSPKSARELDRQSSSYMHSAGYKQGPQKKWKYTGGNAISYGKRIMNEGGARYGDTGGASRFFYVAKASRSERDAGLNGQPDQTFNRTNPGGLEHDPRWAPIQVKNNHPTVKPLKLMRYLVNMITPPGGVILDPFAGSGTTLVAAAHEDCRAIGIELKRQYCEIARGRLEGVKNAQ